MLFSEGDGFPVTIEDLEKCLCSFSLLSVSLPFPSHLLFSPHFLLFPLFPSNFYSFTIVYFSLPSFLVFLPFSPSALPAHPLASGQPV